MIVNYSDPRVCKMLREIDVMVNKWSEKCSKLLFVRFRLYQRATESVEKKISEKEISKVILAQIDESTSELNVLERTKFVNEVTTAIVMCCGAYGDEE